MRAQAPWRVWWHVLLHGSHESLQPRRLCKGGLRRGVVIGDCFLTLDYGVEFPAGTCSNPPLLVLSGMQIGTGSLIFSNESGDRGFAYPIKIHFIFNECAGQKTPKYLALSPSLSHTFFSSPIFDLLPTLFLWWVQWPVCTAWLPLCHCLNPVLRTQK